MDSMVQGDVQNEFLDVLRNYYADEMATLAQSYPQEQRSLWVSWSDLHKSAPDIAFDFLDRPREFQSVFDECLELFDLPVDVDLSDARVRIHDLPGEYTYAPGEIRKDHANEYVSVRGTLERITTTSDFPRLAAWRCLRNHCGVTTVPQDPAKDDLQKPVVCEACQTQGPFELAEQKTEWSDYAKVRIKSRPDESEDADGNIVGYVLDDLIDEGGESGLIGRAGEPVTVSGVVERSQKTGRGEKGLLFDHLLRVEAVEFERDQETVDVEAHRDAFEEMATRDDAVDLFAQSIAPQLHTTDAWDAAMEFAVAFLFGAPRIDLPDGPTYRGDLHFLIVSDYSMGKSTFKGDIEAFSPQSIAKSTTALSSGVGLTAAAVKDDFGEGQWTLKPGLLVRANGGHLILDEIDKGPDELTDMNDALEGEQVVDVEKAGQKATYESRTAVMAMGNPVDGRFNEHDPIADQLGIAESLLSRFDGIVTMTDTADVEQDEAVAETWGKSYIEAQEAALGDRQDFDALDRPVDIETGRAWIKHAREEVTPLLRYEQFESLKEWYAEEVRQLNRSFASDEGEGGDMPVPATARELAAAVKMAIAFARVQLRDEVSDQNIKRAKKLGKRLVKQNWNGERFDAAKNHGATSQQDRYDRLQRIFDASDDALTIDELRARADEQGLDVSRIEHDLQNLKDKGAVYEPQQGKYRMV